ncbi:hypothetical protein QNO09_38620 [Streptomyces sp. 378]|nr:hypothetical protein [Streptomyces sp. 378]MDK1349065.1 hypothetical protein [Streptomyces sp. 378]
MGIPGNGQALAEVERDWRNWITDDDPLPKLHGERGRGLRRVGQ